MTNRIITEQYISPMCEEISLIIESGILNNSPGASVETPSGETTFDW